MDIQKQNDPHSNTVGDKLLSLANTRKVVGISRSKIYQLLEKGDFPRPVKVGQKNFFSYKELQNWITSSLNQREKVGEK